MLISSKMIIIDLVCDLYAW